MARNWWAWGKNGDKSANVYYRRAIGELPEMESSKAVARLLRSIVQEGDNILDIGCGVGHYFRSLRREIFCKFHYTGVDATPAYIKLAQKAFFNQDGVNFVIGDSYNLPFSDRSFNIVLSNNLLLHLPSIKKPLQELCRVANNYVLIRTLIGERSFRIQDVLEDEFDENGEPRFFHYFNIYSKAYINRLLSELPNVNGWEIFSDTNFDPARISANVIEQPDARDATKMIGEWQVNGYILQPWAFIKIIMNSSFAKIKKVSINT